MREPRRRLPIILGDGAIGIYHDEITREEFNQTILPMAIIPAETMTYQLHSDPYQRTEPVVIRPPVFVSLKDDHQDKVEHLIEIGLKIGFRDFDAYQYRDIEFLPGDTTFGWRGYWAISADTTALMALVMLLRE